MGWMGKVTYLFGVRGVIPATNLRSFARRQH
jgi:hypothetical protein